MCEQAIAGRWARGVAVAACCGIVVLAGCSKSGMHQVTGRVHFEDGTPLEYGRVIVDYGTPAGAWGRIKKDGTFRIGTLSETDGMKPGKVRVYLGQAEIPGTPAGDGSVSPGIPLVHPRFSNPATSGLSFEVPKDMKWDIVVEKPPAAAAAKR
jgi:hypothetical protein